MSATIKGILLPFIELNQLILNFLMGHLLKLIMPKHFSFQMNLLFLMYFIFLNCKLIFCSKHCQIKDNITSRMIGQVDLVHRMYYIYDLIDEFFNSKKKILFCKYYV